MIRFLARVGVAVLMLAFLASRVDLAAVRAALVATPLHAVVIATLASFAGNVMIAFRLQALLRAQGVPVTALQTLAINLAAFFYNLLLPVGGVGVAAVRLQRLSRQPEGRFTAALTAMVCDRFLALVALGVIGLVCFAADPQPKPAGTWLVLLAGTATLGVFLAPRAVPMELRRFVRDLQAGGSGTWWSAALLRMSNALGSVARLSTRDLVTLLAISIVAQIPGIVVYTVLGAGLGMSVSFAAMGWVRSVVVLITIMPISIGGLGVREGALVFTLQAYGVASHEALALAILIFATTILAPGLLGGILEAIRSLRHHETVRVP
ncbi:MAG: lysylphosphatidylglycerol synthase transmembrane domain-containing protein [Candidatus Binatia bacterium]